MAYATPQNLIDEYGAEEMAQVADETTLVDGTLLTLTIQGASRTAYTAPEIAAADASLARIQSALNNSTGEIDGYIGAVYALPIVPAPNVLVGINLTMARFRLYDDKAPEEVRARYDDAIRFLRDIARGLATLGVVTGAAGDSGNVECSHTEDDRIFSMNALLDF